jgi:hypothetical protein
LNRFKLYSFTEVSSRLLGSLSFVELTVGTLLEIFLLFFIIMEVVHEMNLDHSLSVGLGFHSRTKFSIYICAGRHRTRAADVLRGDCQ